MGLARQLMRTAARRYYTKIMDRLGSKLVVGLADTSADAPDAFYTPKRDLYRTMVAPQDGQPEKASD